MATAGQPTPVGPAKASPAADELTRQLDELEKRVKALAESGECYADVEAQIAAARAHLAAAEMKDAQEAFDRAADALCRAEASAKSEPLAWWLFAAEVGYLVLSLEVVS
jgi:DNA repair exonuclease SbcCD ATPase subunit